MTDTYTGPDPDDLPEGHPLSGYNAELTDHETHLDALTEYFEGASAEDIRGLMLIVTTDNPAATETIPTMRADVEFEQFVWHQLAAHISHAAHAFDAPPQQVAKHACHVLNDSMEANR